MNDNNKALDIKTEREKALSVVRRKILAMTPENALNEICDYPFPVTLVQSFTKEDLYLLVHSIGPDDALPVLALASNEQWEYLTDMEIWSRDRIDLHAMTQWLNRLLCADADRFTFWVTSDKINELAYYLFKNIKLYIREHDQDPSDFDDSFFTEDNTHYLRLRTDPTANKAEKKIEEERNLFLTDLLKRISVLDYNLYLNLLLNSAGVIPAEVEEELYRLRNLRLAENGFLPFEEAVGVYQSLSVTGLLQRNPKPQQFSSYRVEGYPLTLDLQLSALDTNLFTRTLSRIQDESTLQCLQAEFAGLCNQVIIADQQVVRDKETLAQAVRKTSDYISIGLEKVAAETSADDPYSNVSWIQTRLLTDIFRVGYGCALDLKWRAERWRRSSWFTAAGLPLGFWGENWLGVIGGLLIKKPMFFDNFTTGALYREFATLADIEQTQAILKEIIAFDDLLSLMELAPKVSTGHTFLTFQNLLLTLWANDWLKIDSGAKTPKPLTLNQLKQFFDHLWQAGPRPRVISQEMKENFLNWLAHRSGIEAYDISHRMGQALEKMFIEIETELGSVDKKHLDPRFIFLFLLL